MKTKKPLISKNKKKEKKEVKIPYHYKPENMTLENWQIALRKQVAKELAFEVENIGNQPVFSDYLVYNPTTKHDYKVAIRDNNAGLNFCSCPDFKTNLLGTCKHIEYVLLSIDKSPKLKKIMKAGFHPEYSSLSLRYGSERKVYLRVGDENKNKIEKLASEFFDKNNFLKEGSYYCIEQFLEKVKELNPSFRTYEDAIHFIIEKRERKHREEIITKKYESSPDLLDKLTNAKLYPYQKEGVLFAAKAGRCLIADEMGLGKTIQAIVTCELLIKEFHTDKILIICPTSLKYQWKSEIKKFTGQDALVIEGMPHIRKQKYQAENIYKIISYHVIKNDINEIASFNPDLIILDEAQRIKNWKTKIAQSVKNISSKYALVLTGTPLENKIEEIHSIMQFVDNFRLGPLYKFLNRHQVTDELGKVKGYEHLNEINQTLGTVLVRRTKKEIADQLPERIDNTFYVKMTPKQNELHAEYFENVTRLVMKWRKFGFLSEEDRQRLMIFLGCMRMVSDSTYIIDQKTRHDTKIDELMTILKEIFEREDQKVVIFSQWERMTRLVAQELDELGIGYEYLHGGIPGNKRGKLLENFKENSESRVFLSTDAGGTGLNLQSASYIINLDIPWNPAVLEQRIARVHRLGQKNTVNVINFVSTGSIEQKILALLGFKKSMFEGVLDMGNDSVFMDEDRFSQFMHTVQEVADAPVDETIDEEFSAQDISEDDSDIANENGNELMGESIKEFVVTEHKEILRDTETETQRDYTGTLASSETSAPGIGDLIAKGIDFLTQLSESLKPANTTNTHEKTQNQGLVQHDEKTGEKYLKISLNDDKLVNKLMQGLGAFLDVLKR